MSNKGVFLIIRRKVNEEYEYLCLNRRDPVIINRGTPNEIVAYPSGAFELPGGGLDEGETEQQCAIRELNEEFLWEISDSIENLRPFGRFQRNGSESAYYLLDLPEQYHYWVPKISDEHKGYDWLTVKQIDSLGRYEMIALFRDMLGLADNPEELGVDNDFYGTLEDGIYKCTYGPVRNPELKTLR